MTEQEIRLKFERWYAPTPEEKKAVEYAHGCYVLMQTQMSWEAFRGGYLMAKLETV